MLKITKLVIVVKLDNDAIHQIALPESEEATLKVLNLVQQMQGSIKLLETPIEGITF